ncbi:GntR family transcriptional regulator [Microvirga terrae]|uniref:GntR family transcriptional regulator n=1 Tax=Microvirga terrae TaxID=2740529 RepID=A0ABY5RT01_9HYPH|nr:MULTISPECIES: GntR family transcriptional regulator [Microvirga]MBQ0824672.1 GntR family transcriptional regulator [Microvirga sp. HBU67558]UVF20388.1 GntR family transcriptional regulator [Microvirga terrae]
MGLETKLVAKPTQKSLQHRTIAAAVAESLRERILDGDFKAGFPLRQDALANEFGVSRIPIREALMQLEAEGLVKIHPHRGAIVSELSTEEVEELFELRALLEPRLLGASANRLTQDDYKTLKQILQEYSAELRANHVRRWGELNTQFHVLLYRHAEQPRTLAIVVNLLQECDRHTRLQLSLTDGMKRAEAEHADLLHLCETGQITAACDLLRAHIEDVGKSLRTYLEQHQRPGETR